MLSNTWETKKKKGKVNFSSFWKACGTAGSIACTARERKLLDELTPRVFPCRVFLFSLNTSMRGRSFRWGELRGFDLTPHPCVQSSLSLYFSFLFSFLSASSLRRHRCWLELGRKIRSSQLCDEKKIFPLKILEFGAVAGNRVAPLHARKFENACEKLYSSWPFFILHFSKHVYHSFCC